MQGVHLRKYGVAATIDFELYEIDGVDFRTDWTPAAGDVFMMRDEAAEEQVTNAAGNADLSTLVTDEGRAYSITLALEDMQAARVVVYLVDQATKVFLDKSLVIETYGNASAQHAMDFDDADGSTLTEVGGDGAQLTEAGGDGDHLTESGGDGDQLTAINLPNQTMDIAGTITTVTGNVEGNVNGTVTGKTPSEAGDAMDLAADAIKKVSYDESTAWPLLAADTGATQVARVGADSDTLETLSDEIAAVKSDTAAILTDTGTTLENRQVAILADVTGLNGDVMVGTDDAALASVLGAAVGASISADIAAIPTVDEIWAKAMSDLATGAPSATASVLTAINYLYESWRNKTTTTATLITVMKDDGSTGLVKSTISDDATTFTKGEMVSGV